MYKKLSKPKLPNHKMVSLSTDSSNSMLSMLPKATNYLPLPKASQKIKRATLSEVKLFNKDEMSMVSSIYQPGFCTHEARRVVW